MKKRKYDTAVVLLYLIGRENLLPSGFRKTIPYSTISTWRKSDYTSYIGHEFRHLFIEHSDYLELKHKHEKSQRTLLAVAKAWLSINDISG